MASIYKRQGFWRAEICRRGFRKSHTFDTKSDAETWAAKVESEIGRGVFVDHSEAERTTLTEALDRYEREVLPHKKSQRPVKYQIKRLKEDLGHLKLVAVTSSVLAKYRDERLGKVNTQTARHDLSLLSRVFNVAAKEWGIPLPHGNPVAQLRMPKLPPSRDRRLSSEEADQLLPAAREYEKSGSNTGPVHAIIRFALETAMRRGEIVAMRWEHANLKTGVLQVPDSKSGEPRKVPLSSVAVEILLTQPRRLDGQIWGITADAISKAFDRICTRARRAYEKACSHSNEEPDSDFLQGIRFHDLRHEATSRFFERGFNVMEVAAITGHKTLQMLKRYTHLRAEDLAKKLG
jgi:integrase